MDDTALDGVSNNLQSGDNTEQATQSHLTTQRRIAWVESTASGRSAARTNQTSLAVATKQLPSLSIFFNGSFDARINRNDKDQKYDASHISEHRGQYTNTNILTRYHTFYQHV